MDGGEEAQGTAAGEQEQVEGRRGLNSSENRLFIATDRDGNFSTAMRTPISVLELSIRPDLNNGTGRATLVSWRVG